MRKELKDVEAGDRVWVGNGRNRRNNLRPVAKLTPKQIVLEGDDRYRRDTFRQIGRGGFYSHLLTAVATPEECEQWEAEQAQMRRESSERRAAQEQRDAKRRELNALLPEHASVGDVNGDGEWIVSIQLDEEGVRKLATLLSAYE